jgi:predicted ribosomally synthesized peptide with nif11-like leader
MSMESAKSFFERMKTDEDFRKQVTECKDTEARKSYVKKAGFDFTIEELKAHTGELADAELDKVAAGSSCYQDCTGRLFNYGHN